MEYSVIGFPADDPTLSLDWQAFSYAGKFEMSSTGKAVLREAETIIAAAAFNADRDSEDRAWIRYLTVKQSRQGEQLGPKLARKLSQTLLEASFEQVQIAVNNPQAYRALYKAGFHFTGRETGIAELVLAYPGPRERSPYLDGLSKFIDRDLPSRQAILAEEWFEAGTVPPTVNGTSLPPSDERGDDGTRRPSPTGRHIDGRF